MRSSDGWMVDGRSIVCQVAIPRSQPSRAWQTAGSIWQEKGDVWPPGLFGPSAGPRRHCSCASASPTPDLADRLAGPPTSPPRDPGVSTSGPHSISAPSKHKHNTIHSRLGGEHARSCPLMSCAVAHPSDPSARVGDAPISSFGPVPPARRLFPDAVQCRVSHPAYLSACTSWTRPFA